MRDMFTTVAPRYDFITRAFSFGMDPGWKRLAVERAGLPCSPFVLDLACGTGDFSKLILGRDPSALTVAMDLTPSMLRIARLPDPVCADAGSLPFADACFDAVFVGYGLRNFPDLQTVLREIRRILKPGGAGLIQEAEAPQRLRTRLVPGARIVAVRISDALVDETDRPRHEPIPPSCRRREASRNRARQRPDCPARIPSYARQPAEPCAHCTATLPTVAHLRRTAC